MSGPDGDFVLVRVREARGVTVGQLHFAAGAEFLLAAEAVQALTEQGFVEAASGEKGKPPRRPRRRAA